MSFARSKMCGAGHVRLESIGAVEAILGPIVGDRRVRRGIACAYRATEGMFVETVGVNLYGGYVVLVGKGFDRGTE